MFALYKNGKVLSFRIFRNSKWHSMKVLQKQMKNKGIQRVDFDNGTYAEFVKPLKEKRVIASKPKAKPVKYRKRKLRKPTDYELYEFLISGPKVLRTLTPKELLKVYYISIKNNRI